ncbi:hypothetical protein B0J13DRAFT_39750 [Dactylonectria estremocensis]|uniref:polynucleotide adenylyltransferase n=1 Tax=Dactylonectria estremocensis TaxID=1079267 RepID=A0A9P9JM06_9HYPO|nr:hypothetical protein B0J13DRAFT_39750 [Dactylonectria estremocensis]
MSSNIQSDSAAASSGSPLELESQLRHLSLSNPSGGQQAPSPGSYHVPRGSWSSTSASLANARQSPQSLHAQPNGGITQGDPTEGASQSSKQGRKRPNQAQRRRMNSQFTIPIDPRPQQPPQPRQNYSPNSHYSWPSQSRQSHMHTNSHPHPLPQLVHMNPSHSQNPWNGPPQQRGPLAPGYHTQGHRPESRRGGSGQLYNHRRPPFISSEDVAIQASVLESLCFEVVSSSEIAVSEIAEKEAFRRRIEAISRQAIARFEIENNPSHEFQPLSVSLKCFGSLSSGFATKASDMDLGLLSPFSMPPPEAADSQIPRLLEKAFLDVGLGARLLTRTRVPIIKLCENPPEKLRLDLLDERFKWENGLDNDPHDAHEDDEHEIVGSNDRDDHGQVVIVEGGLPSATEFTLPGQAAGETQTFQLKQGPKSSLSSYYALAKRVLRRAGGRDVTISNYQDFTHQDWDILNRVCHAFFSGLSDSELRKRLDVYPSLSFGDVPSNRSLLGVFTQIEGDQLIQLWKSGGIRERIPINAEELINFWEGVQMNPTWCEDPVSYTKNLQLALERIRKLPSIQFLTLEQGQHETPGQYYGRAAGMVNSVELVLDDRTQFYTHPAKVDDNPNSILKDPETEWRETVMTRYVSGIYQEEIRRTVQEYIDSWSHWVPLEVIARKHAVLHLAWELERALDKDLYEAHSIEDVKGYINLLRSPLSRMPGPNPTQEFIIPLTPETALLVDRIRNIPDPHRMAPNQPRDRYRDRLEFPKTGAGVQCDINFSAHLALQNTLLLRCYSHTDPRVRPMVLFVKHWAKIRGINSGYRGTLSSYGYVLMVLHYLVNVAQPFVCPNLQQLAPERPPNPTPAEMENIIYRGHNVEFWRSEEDILRLASTNQLTHNTDTLGHLLRGFFEYFATPGLMTGSQRKGFDWGRDVLSIRTIGGLLSKQEKGWTGARTVLEPQGAGASISQENTTVPSQSLATPGKTEPGNQGKVAASTTKNGEVKEVRHRYLFAIEDPFELDHNVARTVTHNGIVSIRDEFRRAWRIIKATGDGGRQEKLLRDVNDVEETNSPFLRLLDIIHGVGRQA